MEVKIINNNVITEGICWFCEREFTVDVIAVAFYINGERKGYLCDDCFKMIASGINCPSLQEWEKTHNEMFKAMSNNMEKENV